jgi:hypothetical protein
MGPSCEKEYTSSFWQSLDLVILLDGVRLISHSFNFKHKGFNEVKEHKETQLGEWVQIALSLLQAASWPHVIWDES